MKVKASELKTRPINPETDINFILSTWLKSYRASEHARAIPQEIYYPFHQDLVTQILTHKSTAVTVLCDPKDEDQILGYAVYNFKMPLIHFIYIKFPFRGLGLGGYLFKGVTAEIPKGTLIQCSHRRGRWSKLSKALNVVYNPYIIGEPVASEEAKETEVQSEG